MRRRVLSALALVLACAFVVSPAARGSGGMQGGGAPVQEDPANAKAKATALLNDAVWYLEVKDPATAQQLILQALAAARTDEEIRKRAGELWAQASDLAAKAAAAKGDEQKTKEDEAKQNQLARLDEAERKAARGENDAAATTAMDVLKETKDKDVTDKAKALLENNRPKTSAALRKSWDTVWAWVLSVFVVIFVLLALWLLLRALRRVNAGWANYSWSKLAGPIFSRWRAWVDPIWTTTEKVQNKRKDLRRWVVGAIKDTTPPLGVAEVVTSTLGCWGRQSAPASAGLLKLGTMQLPSVLQVELPDVDLDLTPALEALPLTIGGIKLDSLGKAIVPLRSWFGAKRLWIRGSALADDSTVTVRLTRRNANDTTDTVTATAHKSKAAEAAESASFKMYYLIAKDSSVVEADGADKLREGLKLLAQYVSGRDPKQLEAAYEALRDARGDNPALDEAYLYEGVALDMMERHDEAVTRFEYIVSSDAGKEIKDKAKYNKAVSLFREYRAEKLDEAIALLAELWKPEGDAPTAADMTSALIKEPIKALAYAAQANAVAHKPIFWRYYAKVPEGADDETIKRLKADAQGTVNAWVQEVNAITERLTGILADANTKVSPWDINTRQQLKWAIQNARGNVHLNCASRFYIKPYLGEEEPKLRKEALEQAEDAFRQCEMLLPPGVETLTNLATVLMELELGEDSRDYSQRAIDLNPDYEYAYYRLAQAWERDGRIDELVKVLRLFAKDRMPGIPSFKALYSRHAIELAKFPAAANGDAGAATTTTSTPQATTNTAAGQS